MRPFKSIHGRLYVTFRAMVDSGISEQTMHLARFRASTSWKFIDDPHDKRKVLVCYESLKDKYKLMVRNAFGDPYNSMTLEPLRHMVQRDLNAFQFYTDYTLPNGNKLPTKPDYIDIYTRQAELFNMITYVMNNKRVMKNELCMSMDVFWESIAKIVIADKYEYLPQTVDNIKKRWRKYQQQGYGSLVSNKFGNANTQKISSAEHKALLLKLIAAHHNLEDTVVASKYNEAAAQLGWGFTISAPTVRVYRRKYDMEIAASRKGKSQLIHRLRPTLMRDKPKYAGILFEYDAWTAELLFQSSGHDREGKKKIDYNVRLQMMAVYDPFNDYIVGYHIGKEKSETIRAAIKNAVDNIHRLTGRYFLVNELVTDNFGRGSMDNFYRKAAMLHRPATVGNAKSKTIESFFNRFNNEVCRDQFNTTGHNITSRKDNQPNMDWLDKHKKDLPTVEQGYMQIEMLIQKHRAPREQQWLESYQQLIAEGRVKEIDRTTYLMIFGTTDGFTNRISNAGIRKQISGVEYTYDLHNLDFRRQTFTDWTLIYDTNNLETVLAVNEDGTKRFLLAQKQSVPLAASEWRDEHHRIANKTFGFNRHIESHVTQKLSEIDEVTAKIIDQTPLKTMFIHAGQQKKALQEAQNVHDFTPIQQENTSEEGGVNALFDDVDRLFDPEFIQNLANNNL